MVLNQEIAAAPFDIKDWRQIQYSVNGLEETEGELINFLTAALERHEGGVLVLIVGGSTARASGNWSRPARKVEADSDWGQIHTHSGLQHWREEVGAVLEEEVPWLVLWFHPMESPAIALRRPPEGGFEEQHLATFDWDLDRLADIEAIVRAKSPGGHPDGEEMTRKMLLLERGLRLLQEIQLLKQQLFSGMPGMPGRMDPGK